MKRPSNIISILLLLLKIISSSKIGEKCKTLTQINNNSKLMFKTKSFEEAFKNGKKLGEGGYGEVKLINYYLDDQNNPLTEPKEIAVKLQYIFSLSETEINNELFLLKMFQNTNDIVHYYDCYFSKNLDEKKEKGNYKVFILTEYLPGTLGEQRKAFLKLSEKQRISHYIDLFNGLKNFHSKNLAHLDIKLANIMTTKKITRETAFKLKYIDLGLVKPIGQLGSRIGSPNYMCPDLFGSDVKIVPKFDIYSLIAVIGNIEYNVKMDGNCVDKWKRDDCFSNILMMDFYQGYCIRNDLDNDGIVFDGLLKNNEVCDTLICFVIKYMKNEKTVVYDLNSIINELQHIYSISQSLVII